VVAGRHCSFLRKLGEDKLARPFSAKAWIQNLLVRFCGKLGANKLARAFLWRLGADKLALLLGRPLHPSREWTLSRFTKEQVL
jgi:hypothetical protein